MHHRAFVLVGIVTLAAAVPAAGQGPSAAANETAEQAANETAEQAAYSVPRTPDGQPDLQGFWTNQTYTPLERPDAVAKAFYTPEEAAAIEQGRAVRETSQTTPGTIPDVHYDFTQFGLDRSQSPFARNLRTSLIVDPPSGRIPPMNAEGQRRAEERRTARESRGGQYDRAENLPLGARCIVMRGAGPPMMNAGYNANYHIVQNRDHVMILTEMIHDARIIPLDGRPAPPAGAQGWMGRSRGRWEGDTLVVETTNFNGRNAFRGSGPALRVTERFTRVADDTLIYRFTVEDPETWDVAWTAEMPMKQTIGPIFEHACHEGNYGLTNILAGAREDDRRAAEAAAAQGR